MISYERLRKRPEQRSLVDRVRQAVNNTLLDPVQEARAREQLREQRQMALAEGQKPTDLLWAPQPKWHEESALGMGKVEYIKWLTSFVYTKFPKGSLVTLRSEPFIPTRPPRIWFVVHDINELHYSVMVDRETREPKCLMLKPGNPHMMIGQGDISIYYPPAKLRVLQPEEVQIIDRLRNQAEGTEGSQQAGSEGPSSGSSASGDAALGEARPEEGNI
jgi:hypothetical protein